MKLLVLVIDDERMIHRLIARAVGNEHISCTYVLSMSEAIAALTARTYDVIVLDLALQDSKGLDTFRRVRASAPATPIIVFTGGSVQHEELLGMGAVQVIQKDGSISGEVIREAIHSAAERDVRQAQTPVGQLSGEVAPYLGIIEHVQRVVHQEVAALEKRQNMAREALKRELTAAIGSPRRRVDWREIAAAAAIVITAWHAAAPSKAPEPAQKATTP